MSDGPRPGESDFLAHLVDKALGRSDALAPRLPYLFEPAGPAANGAPGQPSEELQERRDPAPDPQQHTRHTPAFRVAGKNPSEEPSRAEVGSPMDRVRARALSGVEETFATERKAVAAEPAPRDTEVDMPQGSTPADGTEQAIGFLLATPPEPAPRELARSRAPTQLPPGSRRIRTPPPDYQREPAVEWRRPVTTPAHVEPETTLRPRVGISQEGPPIALPAPGRTSPAPVLAPAMTLHRPPRDSPQSEAPAPASVADPVVNVTIGRLEVRAVHAPAVQARSRSEVQRPSPMSLEEYLRGRSRAR